MATFHKFEELDIWQKAQALAKEIYFLCDTNPKIFKDFSFKDQIKRAVLSISNNIAEAFEYNNNNDFRRFLRIAKGSCGEVKNCLLFAVNVNFCQQEDVYAIIKLSETLGKQIGSLMSYLHRNKITKGSNNSTIKPTTNNP